MLEKTKRKEKPKDYSRQYTILLIAIGLIFLIFIIAVAFILATSTRPSPDLAYSTNCGIHLFDLDTETTTYSFPSECTMILDFTLSPDTSRVAYIGNEGNITIAQVRPFAVERVVTAIRDVTVIRWSPDGEIIAAWIGQDLPTGQRLVLLDPDTEEIIEHGVYSIRYPSLSWSPNSQELIFSTNHEYEGRCCMNKFRDKRVAR